MPFTINKIPNEPIIVVTLYDPFTVEDARQTAIDIQQYRSDDYVSFMISDASQITSPFSQMVEIMGEVAGEGAGKINDPQMRVVSVGTDEMVKLSAEAYRQEQYGSADVQIFSNVDEALTYVRRAYAKLNVK
ncbi:MAG: hypothetical protein AAF787_13935 [Chloroflexota bacterium]